MTLIEPAPARKNGVSEVDRTRGEGGLSARLLIGIPVAILVLLPLISWATGLYERIWHWGKFVHFVEGLAFAVVIGALVLGWRDRARIEVTDELATLVTMCAGVMFVVAWKIVEFITDWAFYADVEKSNSDTMTDFLWNDVGVVIGAVLAVTLYRHGLAKQDHELVGSVANWLVDGPSRVLDRHGMAVAIGVAVLAAAGLMAVWLASRPLPGFGVT